MAERVRGRKNQENDAAKLLHQDAVDLHRAISELVRIYQFRDRKRICYYDLSVTQCYALSVLSARDGLGVNDLAGELFLDKSTASRVVDSLENKGYVDRMVDPADARGVKLFVTPKGREIHARIMKDLLEETEALAADFDPDVRQATTRLIVRFARAAAERFGAGGEKKNSSEK